MHFTACKWGSLGACTYWKILPTVYARSSLVKDKYYRELIVIQDNVGSSKMGPMKELSFSKVAIGVLVGYANCIFAQLSRYKIYFCRVRNKLVTVAKEIM